MESPRTTIRYGATRRIDERLAIGFWLALLSLVASFLGALVGVALHIDTTMLEAGFIGAFLGGLPIVCLPALARRAWGPDTRLAVRHSLLFRVVTVAWVMVVVGARALGIWPAHHAHTSFAVSLGGLVAATFASWYLPHFPRALRVWVRQQHPLPTDRGWESRG